MRVSPKEIELGWRRERIFERCFIGKIFSTTIPLKL